MIPFSFAAGEARWRALSAPILLAGLMLAGLLAALYLPLWTTCWKEWWREESAYSHGPLIPLLAGFMIWQRRDRFAGIPIQASLGGLALVLPALLLQLFARWSHSTMISWASFLMLALGGIAFVGGWRLAGRLAGPILFLTFMVPMSKMVTQPIIFGSQMVSTILATLFLRGGGFEVQQVGTLLQLEQYTLQVALPCSGFKTMIALSAFAACFVYLLNGSLAKKLLLFGSALAFSLLANGLRIALVGVAGELVSETSAHWVHDNGGLPVTALALGGLFGLSKLLKCEMRGFADERPTTNDHGTAVLVGRPSFVVRRSAATFVALIAVAALFAWRMPTVQAESKASGVTARALSLQLGQWHGTEQAVPADVQKALPSAHVLLRSYRSSLGVADVTILTGSDATALHDPHDCVIGDGWEFVTDTPRTVNFGDGGRSAAGQGSMMVRDVVMTKGDARARMWYWYAVDDRIYTSTLPARLELFRSRLLEGKKQGAEYVRLIVGGETASARTEIMLTDLARQIARR